MKHQLKTAMIAATLALSSIFALGSTVQAFPKVDNSVNSDVDPSEESYTGTQFTCVPDGNGNVATVGQRPGGEPIPVIIWTSDSSKYFGKKVSPQSRCQIVTERFNQAVTNSGGSLKDVVLTSGNVDVVLTSGKVEAKTVICVLSIKDTGCDGGNTLFTLNPKNAERPDQVLEQIAQISRQGSSAGVIRETGGRVRVKLTALLKGKRAARIQPATRGL